MNIFKELAKGISKTAAAAGKVAPQLLLQSLNLANPGTAVGMVASALGITGAGPEDVLKHIQKNPDTAIEQLIEMEKLRRVELEILIENNKDRADARSLAKTMFTSGDPVIMWFLPLLSVLLLGLLGWMFSVLTQTMPEGHKIPETVLMIVGALMSSVTAMIHFWFSKADKDQNQAHSSNNERR